MEKIFSKVQPGLLLHMIVRSKDFTMSRQDVIDPNNFLQCAIKRMREGETFRSHKHIETPVTYETRKTQESWIMLRGVIRCTLFDINDTFLVKPVLKAGDMCITLHGGHTFTVLEDDSCMIEIKTGPYEGVSKDKMFIL